MERMKTDGDKQEVTTFWGLKLGSPVDLASGTGQGMARFW